MKKRKREKESRGSTSWGSSTDDKVRYIQIHLDREIDANGGTTDILFPRISRPMDLTARAGDSTAHLEHVMKHKTVFRFTFSLTVKSLKLSLRAIG